jgi:hypothetical protein
VGLGTAESFAVLAGSTVTNTGPSVVSGELGVTPGTAVTGFPPGVVVNGVIHQADGVAGTAQADTTTAYNDAAGRPADVENVIELGSPTARKGGVYSSPTSMQLTGTMTLDGENDPSSVFIFQMGSTLTTASTATVELVNGASACNVFWQVGSSATLGTGTTFVGNVLALNSITLTTGASVEGRLLARNGAVTLDTNTITAPTCAQAVLSPRLADPVRLAHHSCRRHHAAEQSCHGAVRRSCHDGSRHDGSRHDGSRHCGSRQDGPPRRSGPCHAHSCPRCACCGCSQRPLRLLAGAGPARPAGARSSPVHGLRCRSRVFVTAAQCSDGCWPRQR